MKVPRVDRECGGERTSPRVGRLLARGPGRRVRADATDAPGARPAPGATQQGEHALVARLPRRPAHHVGRARGQ